MPGQERTKDLVEDSIPGLRCPTCERSSCEEGLTGSLFLDRASLALPCGVWAGAMGKGGVSAQKLNRNPVGRLGCLQECVEAGRGSGWRTGRYPQVAENLADHCGVFNGGEDGQGPAALGARGEVDGEDAFESLGPAHADP